MTARIDTMKGFSWKIQRTTGSSRNEGVLSTWWMTLVATRISASPSFANIGWPLLVLRARRGKLLLVTLTSSRWPAPNV
jgi:hypothetical protein